MSMPKKSKLTDMKSKMLTVRYGEEFAEVVDFLKLQPGGLTAFIEAAFAKARDKMTPEQRKAIADLRKAREKASKA